MSLAETGMVTRCALCGESRPRPPLARGLAADDPAFRVLRCTACGYGWTDPVPGDDEIVRWYPPAYYGTENIRFNPLFERLVRLFRRRRARVIARHAAPGPVLDVGCGRGFILSYLREFGFTPRGVELSEAAAWHARHRLGLDVHVGTLASVPCPPGHFRAIIFWHSLEHIRDAEEAIRIAHERLAPGGLLVVAVPNSDSLQARCFGGHWFHLDLPRHYHHFGARSLRRLLERTGFRIAKTDHFSFEQNPYGWLQSLYNVLGFDFNFLYSCLKSRDARTYRVRRHPLEALATLALLPVLLPVSGALTLIEALLRWGGTVELYAHKTE